VRTPLTPSLLFQTAAIGSLTLRNRVVMAPMATNLASAAGEATDSLIAYYAERARGGVGLLVVENATVEHRLGGNGAVQLRLDSDRVMPSLFHLTEAIHEGGAKAAIQINHAGAVARTPEPIGPSDIPWTEDKRAPRSMTADEIACLIEQYALGAIRAMRAGFDAVEIHGAHGYLIAQFLSPLLNRRTDAFGGSPERRWRFALDVVRAVRAAVGDRFPLLFRVSGDEYLPGGRRIEETCDLACALVEAGVDGLHVTAATAANPRYQLEPMSFSEGWRADLPEAVKATVDVPVIGVGVIRTPETAERLLAEGRMDLLAIGRGLIADPQWVAKAAGRVPGPIHRCISCNRCALHRVFEDRPIRCSVNPRAGREVASESAPVRSLRLVVVGGGPAGLAAASAASRLGHRVTLLEASEALGGRLRVAMQPPHKEKIGWLIDDLIADLPESLDVRRSIRATAAVVRAFAPDGVILATGSEPACLDVPGAERSHVRSADDVLTDGGELPDDVVVIGGGMVGCETALYCAGRAERVTIVELLDRLCGDCEPITRGDILDRLDATGIRSLTGVTVREIGAEDIHVTSAATDSAESIRADLVVCAIGSQASSDLSSELSKGSWQLIPVGDACEARCIYEAIHEGWRAAERVGQASTGASVWKGD